MPIHKSRVDNSIFVEGSCWADVIESDFKKKVSKFRKASDIPKSWAKDLAKIIKEEFSHKAISKKYDEFLDEIEK